VHSWADCNFDTLYIGVCGKLLILPESAIRHTQAHDYNRLRTCGARRLPLEASSSRPLWYRSSDTKSAASRSGIAACDREQLKTYRQCIDAQDFITPVRDRADTSNSSATPRSFTATFGVSVRADQVLRRDKAQNRRTRSVIVNPLRIE